MSHEYAGVLLYDGEHTLFKSNGGLVKFMMKIEQDNRVILGHPDVIEIETTLSNISKVMDTVEAFHHFRKEWESLEPPCLHPAGPNIQENAVATIWMEGSIPETIFSHTDELVFLDTVGRMGWELVDFNGKNFMRKKIE
tara:strand:- start:89 stop:505 length:417 start_codon:yes stop_codon:yes gene_type:complete